MSFNIIAVLTDQRSIHGAMFKHYIFREILQITGMHESVIEAYVKGLKPLMRALSLLCGNVVVVRYYKRLSKDT